MVPIFQTMWLKILILVISFILNIIGTVFLAKASLKSAADIKDLNKTRYDGTNPAIERIFKRDNKKANIGIALLISGITLQVLFTLIEIF